MKSKDVRALTREELTQKFNEALKTDDPEQVAQAMAAMAEGIESEILERAAGMVNVEQLDAQALAARGLRQLTSAEKKYYEKVIDAMKSDDPKQALAHIDVTMPKTIIEDVFEDLKAEHPILDEIDFRNTTYVTEWIMNKNGKQKAAWGKITSEFKKELEGDFEMLNMKMYSLTAFLPVAKSMLDLGAQWLDSYVREVLKDSVYFGLEEAVIVGSGIEQPVGMMKDLSAKRGEEEPYPDKAPIKITKLNAEQYGGVIAELAVSRNGRPRKVGGVVMIVNPVDYFRKVMPATTVLRPDGTYANDVLPYPTKIIQSEEVPEGKAVVGMAKKYFMGIGASKDGVIEHDDSYRFLQRERIYGAFFYGNGRPVDNNAFQVLDISELEPAAYAVKTENGEAEVKTVEVEVEVEKKSWTQEELNAMTVEQMEGLAAYKKYTISGSSKSEKIASFLAAQEAAKA